MLDALGALVDKSLVGVDTGDTPRYRLLESARVFALEQLAGAGEVDAVHRRHAQAVCAVFVRAAEQRFGEGGRATPGEYMALTNADVDNARAALEWAERSGDWPTAVALAGAAAPAFMQLGLTAEIGRRLQALASRADDSVPPAQAAFLWRMLKVAGPLLGMTTAEATASAQRAVELSRRSGSRHRLIDALYTLGMSFSADGQFDDAQRVLNEMMALDRPGDPPRLRGQRLHLQHILPRQQGRFEEALLALAEEQRWYEGLPDGKLELWRNYYHQCVLLNALGRHEDVVPLARALLAAPGMPNDFGVDFELIEALAASGRADEALALAFTRRRQWTHSLVLKFGLPALMQLAAARGRPLAALRIHAAAMAFLAAEGAPVGAIESSMRERLRQRCLAAIPAAELDRRLAESIPLEEGAPVALALDD